MGLRSREDFVKACNSKGVGYQQSHYLCDFNTKDRRYSTGSRACYAGIHGYGRAYSLGISKLVIAFPENGLASKEWLDTLINDSPFKDLYLTKDVDEVLVRGMEMNVEEFPYTHILPAMAAYRLQYENSCSYMGAWIKDFVESGMTFNEIMYMSNFFAYGNGDNTFYATNYRDHGFINPTCSWSKFLEGPTNPRNLSPASQIGWLVNSSRDYMADYNRADVVDSTAFVKTHFPEFYKKDPWGDYYLKVPRESFLEVAKAFIKHMKEGE